MLTRRRFLGSSLQAASVLSLGATAPEFLVRSLQASEGGEPDRILVVIELSGGNDGLNTVIPYADENYPKYRRTLRIPESRVLKLDGEVGLHPALRGAADLVEDGRLAIVQGVGYPNPNRSHFQSMAIWQSARFEADTPRDYGWLGRALDERAARGGTFADAVCIGDVDPPLALRGRHATHCTIRNFEELQLDRDFAPTKGESAVSGNDGLLQFVRRRSADAQLTAERISELAGSAPATDRYPGGGLGTRLKSIARLIRGGMQPRVYYTMQPGYDTHSGQFNDHFQLLAQFGSALKAFLDDLRDGQLADRVLVMVFSEFGRRVDENDSGGTDHGTAAPMFVAGPAVQAGLHGATPRLDDLDDGDLKMTVDFRQVYATLLEQWLRIDSRAALDGQFEPLPLIRS